MPVFGIGTWMMGGAKVRDEKNDDARDIQAIKNAIDAGVTHIDSAENYAAGWAESLVGKAIQEYDRKHLFLTTKVGKNHLKYNELISAANASLERLRTDYLDLYLIHAPNDEVPLSETLKAMDDLVAKGYVKHIGVSNFTTSRLIAAQQLTANKIVTNQVYYNVLDREPEADGLLQYCQKHDVMLTAYRPIDKGMLVKEFPHVILEVARKYHKTPTQVTLNWLISQKNVITISKMSDSRHLKENLAATDWKMEETDIEKIRLEYPGQIKKSDNLPLL